MKWMKSFLLLVVLSTANFAYADKISMCDIAKQAAEGTLMDFDPEQVDVNVICNEDIQINKLKMMDPDAFDTSIAKWQLKMRGYTDETKFRGFNLSRITDVGLVPLVWLIILFFASIRTGLHLRSVAAAVTARNQKMQLLGFSSYVVVLLIGFLLLTVYRDVRATVAIQGTVPANGVHNVTLLSMASQAQLNADVSTVESLNAYVRNMDESSKNLLRNAFKEENTKYNCLRMNANNLARSDYLSFKNTTSTMGEIFNNFENNLKYKLVPEKDQGNTYQYNAEWNHDFDDYIEDKYCSQSTGFQINAPSFPLSLSDVDNDELGQKIINQAIKDAQEFMTPERITQTLNKFETEAYNAVKNSTIKTQMKTSDDLVKTIQSNVDSGLKNVEEIISKEKINAAQNGYYINAYVAAYTAAIKGVNNNQNAIEAKFTFARRHAVFAKAWNCSNRKAISTETVNLVTKLNGKSGENFANVSDDIVKMNWQCLTLQKGKILYLGTDDATKTNELQVRALASAAALVMFDSRVQEGVDRGANSFKPKVDVYRNEILSYGLYGRAALGQAAEPFTMLTRQKNKLNYSIKNSMEVSYSGEMSNENYLDMVMLMGAEKDAKELEQNPYYRNILSNMNAMYLESLIDVNKGRDNLSFESAKIKENDSGFMEKAKSFIEGFFDYNVSMKHNLGMNPNKSFSAGYAECKANRALCDSRYSGTLNDIVAGSGQDMFGAAFKFYIVLELMEVAKMVGDMGSLVDIGFGGKGGLSGLMSTALSFVGKGAAIFVTLLYSLLVGFRGLIDLAMTVGFITGWIIPMFTVIIGYMHTINTLFAFHIGFIIFLYKLTKAYKDDNVLLLIDAGKVFVGITLVQIFSTAGLAFVIWATSVMTIGHELRALLGITSDIMLIGSLAGTISIQVVGLILYYHIYSLSSKAGAIGEQVSGSSMNLSDTHSQNKDVEGFILGASTRLTAVNISESVKNRVAEHQKKKKEKEAKAIADSREAGREAAKSSQTEGI
ncbi:hypothetical protein I5R46_06550 [Pseudomonas aeruginosa]|nr:hypothetical protein [Pseudomonas aeruginosa]